jgi:hypothetical protein
MPYNPNLSATTKDLIASESHCRECKKDIFWSLELGLNIVGIYISQKEIDLLRKQYPQVVNIDSIFKKKFEGMRILWYKELNTYLFISIWCPYCNRIQNKDIYIPKWKIVKGKRIIDEMPKLSN